MSGIENDADNPGLRIERTIFLGWPWICRSGYRVSFERSTFRYYTTHRRSHRFRVAIEACAGRRVEISEAAWREDSLNVAHEILVDGVCSWIIESFDRRTFMSPSYRILDADHREILTFPRQNWCRYNMFGHVLVSSSNARGEVRLFEHGGAEGRGWPVDLLIGIDLFKEFFEPG